METSDSADDVASSILLADVTSLMLLSAAADKFTKSGKDKLKLLLLFVCIILRKKNPWVYK